MFTIILSICPICTLEIHLMKQNGNISHCNYVCFSLTGMGHGIIWFLCSSTVHLLPNCWLKTASFSLDTVLAHASQHCLTGSLQGWCVLGDCCQQAGRVRPSCMGDKYTVESVLWTSPCQSICPRSHRVSPQWFYLLIWVYRGQQTKDEKEYSARIRPFFFQPEKADLSRLLK